MFLDSLLQTVIALAHIQGSRDTSLAIKYSKVSETGSIIGSPHNLVMQMEVLSSPCACLGYNYLIIEATSLSLKLIVFIVYQLSLKREAVR